MKRLAILILTALLVSSQVAVSAQDDIDIAAVSEEIAAVDTERLLMRLNTPIAEELLPTGFSTPEPLSGELLAEQRARFVDTLEGLSGSATYTVEYTPTEAATPAVDEAASPTGSPVVRGPQAAFASAGLTYLLFSQPIDVSNLDAFGTDIQTALGTDAQSGTVEEITVAGAPAILVSTVSVVNALEFHTEWIAIPVGNVMVVALVTEGSDTFDEARFRADNEALALSGVAYLDRILQDMMSA